MNKEEILKELGIIQNKLVESQAKANSQIILSSIEKRNKLEEKISRIKIEEQQNKIEIAKTKALIASNKDKSEAAIGKIAALGEDLQAVKEGPDFNKQTGIIRTRITNLRKKKDGYLENVSNNTDLLEDYNLQSKIAGATLISSSKELEDISKSFEEKTAVESIIEDVKNDKLSDEELLNKMVTLRESMSDDFYNNDMFTANNEVEENLALQAQCEAEIKQYEAKLADEANYPVIARANSRNIEAINKENEKIAAYHIKLEESKLEALTYENKNNEIDKEFSKNNQAIKKLNDEKATLWFQITHTTQTSDNYNLIIDSVMRIKNIDAEISAIEVLIAPLDDEKTFNNNIIEVINNKQASFDKFYAGLTANLDQRNNNVLSAAKQADQDKLQQAKDALLALKNRSNYINSYLEETMYNFEDKLQASIEAEKNNKKVSELAPIIPAAASVFAPIVAEEPIIDPLAEPILPFVNKKVEPIVTDTQSADPFSSFVPGKEIDKKKKGPSKLVAVKEASKGVLEKIKSWSHKNKFAKWAALILAIIIAVGLYAGYEMFECLQGKEPIPTSSLFDAGVSKQTISDYTEALNTTAIPTVTVTPTGTTISTQGAVAPTKETATETTAIPTETTAPVVTPAPTTAPTMPIETTAPIVTPTPTPTPTAPTETTATSLQNIEVLPNERWDLGDGVTYIINTPDQGIEINDPTNIIVGEVVRGENGNVYFTIDTSLIQSAVR